MKKGVCKISKFVDCEKCKYFGTYLGSASERCIKPKYHTIKKHCGVFVVTTREGTPSIINKHNDCPDFETNKIGKFLRNFKSMFYIIPEIKKIEEKFFKEYEP